MIIVNFKTYKRSFGEDAVKIARIVSKVPNVYVAVQATDIVNVSRVNKRILAQHIDPIEPGRNTGYVLPEAVKSAGAIGTLINHSEHRMTVNQISKIIERCKKNGLKSIVCVQSLGEALKILKFKPSVIAYEDPKLIATSIPITSQGNKIRRFFYHVRKRDKRIPILCGAGITHPNDVAIAHLEGYSGVLVAHAVLTSRDPKKLLNLFSKELR